MGKNRKNTGTKPKASINLSRLSPFELLGILIFILIFIGVPYSIQLWQGFDDALFIKHAINISEGNWLGKFDELTLIKGPGYPIFLAINHTFGLNIALSQALFWSSSLVVFYRILPLNEFSRKWSISIFLITLFDPRVFLLDHPIRETIYTSQALLSLALIIFAFYSAESYKVATKKKYLGAIGGGLTFGWFWLTREEGYWLIPSIFLLITYFGIRSYNLKSFKEFWLKIVTWLLAFLVVILSYFSMNALNYGSFSGVDITEKNLLNAISSLESIKVGPDVPFVSVTRAMRFEAYKYSPTFALLQETLDPVAGHSQWENVMCTVHATTCGEIPNGFFIFAFRQAVGKVGEYGSPETARALFKKMASEIQKACTDKNLTCTKRESLLPLLPPITANQWNNLPTSIGNALSSLVGSGYVATQSRGEISGTNQGFDFVLSYLGRPTHFALGQGDRPLNSPWAKSSLILREFLVHFYALVIPVTVVSGLIFLFFPILKPRLSQSEKFLLIIATSLILATLLRSFLLILIDISSFPSIQDGYFNAAYSFLFIGTLLSTSVWINFFRRTNVWHK